MKIKIPNKVKINGLKYEIEHKKLEEEYGSISYENMKIEIEENIHPQQQELTFIHELLHAILEALYYRDLNNDEKFVEDLSRCLHQVLIDNNFLDEEG